MEKITGTATKVRNTVSIGGGGRDTQVTTTHISIFQVNGRQIQVKSNVPIMISEDDKVILVGSNKKGVFQALAQRNLTTSVDSDEGWMSGLILGVVMVFFGIAIVTIFASVLDSFGGMDMPESMIFKVAPKIVGGIFFVIGIYSIFHSVRVFQAVSELRQENELK